MQRRRRQVSKMPGEFAVLVVDISALLVACGYLAARVWARDAFSRDILLRTIYAHAMRALAAAMQFFTRAGAPLPKIVGITAAWPAHAALRARLRLPERARDGPAHLSPCRPSCTGERRHWSALVLGGTLVVLVGPSHV